jgi:F-type H+-transporting ATPase subunit b
LEFHPVDVIISLINIVVLFVLLRLILWKHVIRILTERSGRVRMESEEAEKHRMEAEALKSEYVGKLGDIESHGRDLIRESQAKASEEADTILKETREKAKEMIREAQAHIEEEKKQAIEEAHQEVVQIATDMAAHILKREVSPDDNINAVDDFFREQR